MYSLSFDAVNTNYFTRSSAAHSCSMAFPNTCAIRMSEAIVDANSNFLSLFRTSGKNTCEHGYIRGAQDLGAILRRPTVLGKPSFGWESPGARPVNVLGKRGIICFMNIPGFDGQGHIDLWENTSARGSAYWDAATIWLWKI